MELMFPKSDIAYLGRIVQDQRNAELTQEIKLSDGMPDIGRVLACWGMPLIRGKEWRRDRIAVNGGVTLSVLYLPEDGTDPRCVESWLPFQMEWDIRDCDREGQIWVRPLVRFADARSLSSRKLMVRAGVALFTEAFVSRQTGMAVPEIVDGDIQLLKTTYPLQIPKYAGEKSFLLDEDLSFPTGSPSADKLLCYTVRPEITEQRISGDRVVFRGNANLHLVYRCPEGKLHSQSFVLPFSQLGELPEVTEGEAWADVALCATSLEVNLEENGHLRVKCGLVGQYAVSCRIFAELAEDVYSISRDVSPQMGNLELPVILERRQESLSTEQTLPQDGGVIVDVQFYPDFPKGRRQGNDLELELPGQFQVLYYGENGMLQSATARWEGSFRMPAGENTVTDAFLFLKEPVEAQFSGGQLHLRVNTALDLQTRTDQVIPFVAGLELGAVCQPDPGRPSLILRRVEDQGLWSLAKQYGSTVEAIRKVNSLQTEPERGQMLLIPVS